MKKMIPIKVNRNTTIEYTERELSNIFRGKIKESRERLEGYRRKYFSVVNKSDKSDKWVESRYPDYIEWEIEEITKWERKLDWVKNTNTNTNTSIDIEAIRRYASIDMVMGDRGIKPTYTNSKFRKYLCPMHNEKTASFYWYLGESGSGSGSGSGQHGHCYGCGWHGGIIDLYMAMNGMDFKDAIRELNKMI
jgi:hypothetical protein